MQNGTMMQGGTTMDGGMMQNMTPTAVTGTVLRYYVDMAGFVTAMDVQTADGVRMVRFSPSSAQMLVQDYKVGSTINAYVTSSMMNGMTSYSLAGVGTEMPRPSAMMSMMPMTVSDIDVLRAQPYVMLGARNTSVSGRLSGYVSDPDSGEILAIVITSGSGDMKMKTLVRVPRENRLMGSAMGVEGVTPLTKGARVVAFGMEEAPRFGMVSPYAKRLIASTISVDGQSLGRLGFGSMMSSKKNKTLLGFDLNLGGTVAGTSAEEMQASNMGYSTYMMPGAPMMGDPMTGGTNPSGAAPMQ